MATIRLNEKTLAELRVPADQAQAYYWDTEIGISELDLHVLTNHAFASHSVNATYIAQALPHLARCQAAIETALWKRIKSRRKHTRSSRRTATRSSGKKHG